jgi:DNA-binding winged helix-turn-helix (wHTH) protein
MDAMQRIDDAGRAGPLILELASGTARLHGEELELPPREFRLLAALAARVGQPVEPKALIEAVWPDEPWTSNNDLYVLVSKLRRLIDGPTKFGNHIRNRRGVGYLLDLEPDQLVVIDPDAVEPTPITIDLTDQPTESSDTEEETSAAKPTEVLAEVPKRRAFGALPIVALILFLLVASWGAGYMVSRRASERPATGGVEPERVDAQPDANQQTPPEPERNGDRRKSREERKGRGTKGSDQPAVIAGPGSSDTPSGPASGGSGVSQGSGKGSQDKKPPTAPLPPAPTRYLYHLVNAQTGDHFVTTDGNTASEYEAKGYEGGAIGRIYSYQEEGTRAITTDAGTAYIFISSSPKTEPASKATGLWYSTNNNGDFFYTTSESEAKQAGWSGSLIGYVRSL